MLGNIPNYEPPSYILAPCNDVQKLGGHRWHYDLWYGFILHAEYSEQAGDPYFVPPGAALALPARFGVKACNATLVATYKHVSALRPFSFFDVLPALRLPDVWLSTRKQEDHIKALGVSFYAPRGGDGIRRSDTHELVTGIEHKTIGECVREYFVHKAWTMEQPHGVGLLERRTVHVVGVRHVGKETNEIEADLYTQSGGVLGEDAMQQYAGTGDGVDELRALLERYDLNSLATKTKIGVSTLHHYRDGGRIPPRAATTLLKAINKSDMQPVRARGACGTCATCGAPIGGNRNQRYCRDACKMAAYRQRKTHAKEQAGT
jgi:hypothetical protein